MTIKKVVGKSSILIYLTKPRWKYALKIIFYFLILQPETEQRNGNL